MIKEGRLKTRLKQSCGEPATDEVHLLLTNTYMGDTFFVMEQNGKANEYAAYMEGLWEKQRAKRSFIAMLDSKKL